MILSRLLLRRFQQPKLPISVIRLLSTSAVQHDVPPPPEPKTTLSDRMSFVFDQIDAVQRARDEKDEALQRIRAWRHSKLQQQQRQQQELESEVKVEEKEVKMEEEEEEEKKSVESVIRKEVELVHPWPEWIELMERLLQQNYFDHRRVDEDKLVENFPSVNLSGYSGSDMAGSEFWRDWVAVCTACRNFGHDRFDILKSLSKKDIQVLVGYGCPSMDGKVAYSAKLLRKHAHVNEGDVCSACSLRSSCKKGFLHVPKEDKARTLDVMRVLLTFGFDSINGSVKNQPLMKMKSVKTVVRKLLHEIVKLAAVPIDPNLPRPVVIKPPPKVKQTPPPPKKRVGRDDIEMKKGDWLCPKCDFMNFAKNAICLQCDAKRPKRQLLPGEWECPKCSFLNYRRNMVCFHCECKRPPDEYMESQLLAKQQEQRTGSPGNLRMQNVSDAWNFDFDENESDGADVAAFEFADPPPMSGSASPIGLVHGERTRGFDSGNDDHANKPRNHERTKYFHESDGRGLDFHTQRTGFDDFDDEEYDVDGYEIDMSHNSKISAIPRRNLSEFENSSESEDDFDDHNGNQGVEASRSNTNDGVTGSDSEVDLVDHPHWKSSKYKCVSYISNDELNLHSDSDDDLREGYERLQKQKMNARQKRSYNKTSGSIKSFENNDSDRYNTSHHRMESGYSHHKTGWDSPGSKANNGRKTKSLYGRQTGNYNKTSGSMKSFENNDSDGYNRHHHRMESGYSHPRTGWDSAGSKVNNRRESLWNSNRVAQVDRLEYSRNRSGDYNIRSFDSRQHSQKSNRRDLWCSERLSRREEFDYNPIASNGDRVHGRIIER